MANIDSLLDIFQTVNSTKKHLVESLYVDEACYNEELNENTLNKTKVEGVYPYSYISCSEDDKSIIIFKDLIKDTELYTDLYSDEEIIYKVDLDDKTINGQLLYNELELDAYAKSMNKNMSNPQKENMNVFMTYLKKFAKEIGIKNDIGLCCILGQVAHESGNFKDFAEIGKGRNYKYGLPAGPFGKVYYGRGPVQVTWYENYRKIYEIFFKKIGYENYNVVKEPDLALDPAIGSLLSIGWFKVTSNGERAVNAANEGNVRACTKAINGGYNGLEDRQRRTIAFADMMGIPRSEIHLNA